jgi:hypothetical protein
MGPLRLIWRLIGCIKNLSSYRPDVRRLVVTRRLIVTYPVTDPAPWVGPAFWREGQHPIDSSPAYIDVNSSVRDASVPRKS